MFALNMRDAPYVQSYREANDLLKTAMGHPWRGNHAEFPIPGKRNNKSISVRPGRRGDVIFRYHRTDVITWHKTGAITLVPYPSRSTCSFFNNFCPPHMHLTRDATVLIVGATGYPIAGSRPLRVKNGRIMSKNPSAFAKTVVNKEGAKKVLAETRYAEYCAWHKAILPLLKKMSKTLFGIDRPEELLADEDQWVELALGVHGDPNRLREAIYAAHYDRCYRYELCKSLPSDSAHESRYRVISTE